MYSVYSPLNVRQPSTRSNVEIAKGMGVESARLVDSNCVLEIQSHFEEIIQVMRRKCGPAFLEFKTYRWREHCGPNYDNNIGYRDESEFLEWQAKDPLERLRHDLNLYYQDFGQKEEIIANTIREEISSAFEFAEESAFPSKYNLYENIYEIGRTVA